MKKLLTLLFSAAIITSVSAQKHQDERVATHDQRNNDNNYHHDNDAFERRQRDAQIQQINRDYYMQVQSIKSDRRLSRSEKNSRVSRLERQRDRELRMVQEKQASNTYAHYDNRSGGFGKDRH